MKLSHLLTFNAILFIGMGIAFALYGPLMIAMFGILNIEGDSLMYWYAASFARMFGAALFGFGFLFWAVRRSSIDMGEGGERRGILFAIVLAYLLGSIVAITQQVSIWGTLAGWVTVGLFLALLAGYSYFLVRQS